MTFAKTLGLGVLLATLAAPGCSQPAGSGSGPAKAGATAQEGEKKGAHAHGKGPNGGVVFDLGKYHAEFTVDHDKKQCTILVLSSDEKTPTPTAVAAKDLSLTTKETKTKEGKIVPSLTITLAPTDETGGKASKFVGTDPGLGNVADFAGTVVGEIDGKPAQGEFKEEPEGHSHLEKEGGRPDDPKGRPKDREVALFLTPGGIYTAADIEQNGKVVPSEKFKGLSWAHDDDLKPGDKMCPVTANKADPQCEWVVNGRKYEFCCPPCLEKFVTWAKTQPDKVKPPEQYVK